MRPRLLPLLVLLLLAAGLLHACGGGGSGGGKDCVCPGGQCVDGACRGADGGVGPSGAGASTTLVACEQPVVASAPTPPGTVVYDQVVTVGKEVPVVVPDSPPTASITVIQQAVDAPRAITIQTRGSTYTVDNVAIPITIRDPNQAVFYSDLQSPPADGASHNLFFSSNSPGTGSITIPNTTRSLTLFGSSGVTPGTWTFTVSDWSYECTQPGFLGPNDSCTPASKASRYRVTAVLKGGAGPASGNVNVRFYVNPQGKPISLDAANPSPALARMVSTYASVVRKLTGSAVTTEIRNYPAPAQAPFSGTIDADLSGPCSDIAQLLRFSEPNANTINLFLVSDIKATDPSDPNGTTTVVGVDGSIPGPATVSGTVQSGAVVSLADFAEDLARCGTAPDFSASPSGGPNCGADATAYVAAHETGHFLGLYHTTEATGDAFDPIDDTPNCDCTLCRSRTATNACLAASPSTAAPHLMMATECSGTGSCGGGDNLMFWLFQPEIYPRGTLPALTPQQRSVMLASPAFH